MAALGLSEDGVSEKERIAQKSLVMDLEVTGPQGTRTVRTLLDSGAQANFISQMLIAEMGAQPVSTNVRVRTVAGQSIRVYGKHRLDTYATDMRHARRKYATEFIATDIVSHEAILGLPWLREVNPDVDWRKGTWRFREDCESQVIQVSLTELLSDHDETALGVILVQPVDESHMEVEGVTLAALEEVELDPRLSQYAEVFQEPSEDVFATETKTRHHIPLIEGETAPWGPIYSLSANELRVLREYLESALQKGWIQPSESSAGAPILFVQKQDGSLRLCVDYRGLNRVTKKNRYPLPLIPEILDRLSGAQIFTKLDLRDAYHRIRVAEEDRWKTAFRTRYGHFEYLVMPFGLTNAPATFQGYINEALRGLLDNICVAYMDDILIFSRDEEEHEKHVRLVLERLKEYSLYAKLSKCKFFEREVDFLGYRVGVDGVSMDPSRVEAIREWPVPKSFRDIQVFLGFANFYRGFISRYSRVVAPITNLLVGMVKGKKTGPFEWTGEADHAFRTLKDCFSSAPMLAHFDPERQSRVEVDASGEAIGGVLTQAYETQAGRTQWKPVAFFSRKMTPAERNYHTGDGEMLAIVHAFKEWRHYLEAPAKSTIVLTDHEALQCFMTTKVLNKRQMRWADVLAAYDFHIQWRRGKDNPADGLSRRPDHMGKEEPPSENILRTLLSMRMRAEDDPHAGRVRSGDEVIVGLMTRSMVQSSRSPTESVYNVVTLPTSEEQSTMIPSLTQPELANLRNRRDSLATRLQELQALDKWCQEAQWTKVPDGRIQRGTFKGTWDTDQNGIVRRNGLAYVPHDPATRQEIYRVNHDDPWEGGHFGERRTADTIMRYYWWPQIRRDVYQYVDSCDICQRMKVPRHKPYGKLEPLPVPKGPWEDISMDFIVGLPPSMRGKSACDAILVIVDRYSKMVVLTPCNGTIDAREMAEIILEKIVAKYGAPKSIVTDRGTVFTSSYWGSLCSHLATRRLFSTAFHPQTDGQTERMNQTLECYLRCYVNYQQSDWATLLPSAEYAMNSQMNATTKETPFSKVYRFSPTMHVNLAREKQVDQSDNPLGDEKAKKLDSSLTAASEAQSIAEEQTLKMAGHYDKKRIAMQFNIGDKVLLRAKHIRTLRASKKLAEQLVGPFQIVKRIGANAYQLDLPVKYGKLHHTFHVSLLQAYRGREGVVTPEPEDIEGEEEWEVEEILDERVRKGKTEYYVRWKGFNEAYDTWEPEEHMRNAREEIANYKQKRKG